jgi:hypothetical protein
MLSERYISRIKSLAGVNENVKLVSNDGRSDSGTISWFCEEYLLSLGSTIVNSIDASIAATGTHNLSMSRSSTKMVSNNIVTKLFASAPGQQDVEITFSLSVNLEKGAETVASVTLKGATDHFSLSSKHSGADLQTFTKEISENITNNIARDSRN